MLYFNLSINELPQICSACSASTDKYRMDIKNSKRLEITTVEGGSVCMTVGGQQYQVPPRSVIVIMPGMSCLLEGEGVICDDTIAVTFGHLQYETLSTEEARMADARDEDTVMLPMVFTPGDDYANFSRIIRTFISYYVRESAFARCRCLSLWFDLLAQLNLACRNELMGCLDNAFLPSAQMYVRKAKTFIDRNYSRRLRIPDVAEQLRITPNYLSSMFKQITGKTVLDYIHMVRIQAVKNLLNQPHPAPLAEIAAETGLGSARNLSARFKEISGVTVKEYLRISNELTLYHNAPWDKPSVSGEEDG